MFWHFIVTSKLLQRYKGLKTHLSMGFVKFYLGISMKVADWVQPIMYKYLKDYKTIEEYVATAFNCFSGTF